MKNLAHFSTLLLILLTLFSCADNKNKKPDVTTDIKTEPISQSDSIEALKKQYTYVKATFAEFNLGDLEHYSFVNEDDEVIGFEGNNGGYDFAMGLPDSEANSDNQGWGTNPEHIGKTFHIFFNQQYNETYEIEMNIIQSLILTDDPIREIDLQSIYNEGIPEYLVKLDGNQAVIQYEDKSYSEPMTMREGFDILQNNQTLYLNTMGARNQLPIVVQDLENIKIFTDDTFYSSGFDKPVFTLKNVKNASITGFTLSHHEGAYSNHPCLEIIESSNITFNLSRFKGEGELNEYGVLISDSENVTIENSEFETFIYGVKAINSKRINVKNNSFSDIKKDNFFESNPDLEISSNIVHGENEKFIVKIDRLKNNEIKYTSWSKPKTISEKPDLELFKGTIIQQGTSGGYDYKFKNGEWEYMVQDVQMGETEESIGLFLSLWEKNQEKLRVKLEDHKVLDNTLESYTETDLIGSWWTPHSASRKIEFKEGRFEFNEGGENYLLKGKYSISEGLVTLSFDSEHENITMNIAGGKGQSSYTLNGDGENFIKIK